MFPRFGENSFHEINASTGTKNAMLIEATKSENKQIFN